WTLIIRVAKSVSSRYSRCFERYTIGRAPQRRGAAIPPASFVSELELHFAAAGGHRLEYAWHGRAHDARPPIVMLHEGLGSLAMWRDFPHRLAHATQRRVLGYSRYGYGRSDPLTEPRRTDFMHVEALEGLPALL